jgi:hypothetical protein
MNVLPEKILHLMSPEDRKALGKAGWTKAECEDRAEAKNERELSRQIVSLLRRHGIEPIVSRTDKRSTNNVGTPDILFALGVIERPFNDCGAVEHLAPVACAWELKHGNGKFSEEQKKMGILLQCSPNSWRYRVIRSYDEALDELKALGLQQNENNG